MLRFASSSRLTPFPTPNSCRTLSAKYDAQLCWARVNCCKVSRRDFHRGTKGLRSAVEKGDEVEQAFRPASRWWPRSRGFRDPGGSSSITRPTKPRNHPGLEKRETLRQAQGRLWGTPSQRFNHHVLRHTSQPDISQRPYSLRGVSRDVASIICGSGPKTLPPVQFGGHVLR